jgi:hypothetical protein
LELEDVDVCFYRPLFHHIGHLLWSTNTKSHFSTKDMWRPWLILRHRLETIENSLDPPTNQFFVVRIEGLIQVVL